MSTDPTSYLHSTHAGNHGDVLKHLVFLCVIQELTSISNEGIIVSDSHAGIGRYSLCEQGGKEEYKQGIARIIQASDTELDVPQAVTVYVRAVQSFNGPDELRIYPGSPALAHSLLRHQDEQFLWELNPCIFQQLKSFLCGISSRATIFCQDGFTGVVSKLKTDRRNFILIDPPYKDADEYSKTLQTVQQVLNKSPKATVMVWIPHLANEEARQFDRDLLAACNTPWVRASITVSTSGLKGSTVFVMNPPPSLYSTLQSTMPWLAKQLAQDCSDYSLTQST